MVDVNSALSDVKNPAHAFWFTNGVVTRNIYELVSEIESCRRNVFEYHVNPEKNDFYKWILDVLGDYVLAREIKTEKDHEKFAKKIRKRIKELEKDNNEDDDEI